MGTFVKMLNIEVAALEVKDLYEPDCELQPNDQKVGELSEHLIRLWTLWKMNEKVSEEKFTEAKFFRGSVEERQKVLNSALEFQCKAATMEMIFWLEVREETKIWDKRNLGIRKGRIAVLFEIPPPKVIGLPFQFGS